MTQDAELVRLTEENERLRSLLRVVCEQPILAGHPAVRAALIDGCQEGS